MAAAVALMTVADLQAEFVQLANQLSIIDGRRREIDSELTRRLAVAKSRINDMTPEEVDALRAELGLQR